MCKYCKKFKSDFVFEVDCLIKERRPGYKEPGISCKAYPPDRRLCIYTVLKEHLSELNTCVKVKLLDFY